MPGDESSQTLKLNVFFHGTFAFVEENSGIRALIPDIQQHSIRAGNWLGETELAGANAIYKLEGVGVAGGASFDPKLNLFVKYKPQDDGPKPYATLVLPRPANITSLRVADVPRTLFNDPSDLVSPGNDLSIATLQIFSYNIGQSSVNDLRLATGDNQGHYWEPVLQKKKKKKDSPWVPSVNLHVFSTEDHHEATLQDQDFDLCVKLLGANVTLKPGFAYQAAPVNPDEVPDGVDPKETEDLAIRTQRMARLGRLVTQSANANQAWYEDDALDDSTENCGNVIGH